MDKIELGTPNITQENISKLIELFPQVATEVESDGELKQTVDFDALKELLGDVAEGLRERYQFTWPGKRKAKAEARRPINKTMIPCPEKSVNWDTTENLYIEGDNLDALKILRETYAGKVKLIYIDPPYNTGHDFVYDDDFTITESEHHVESGEYNEEGGRLVTNTEGNGRFHSDWCSMMYPRLLLAKDMLTPDGLVFISIDDNEAENLRKICSEVFGSTNFIAEIVRESIKGGSKSSNIKVSHDYIICYAKNLNMVELGGIETDGLVLNLEDSHGKYAKGRELNKWGAGSRREDSPSMFYAIPGPNGEDVFPIRNDGSEGRWRLGKSTMAKLLEADNAIFEPRGDGTYIVYEKLRDDSPRVKQFTSLFVSDYLNSKGTDELKTLFGAERSPFDYAKPTQLIYDILRMSNDKEAILLDFFSGSATAAHATMRLNSEDGGKRKFVLVQIPEKCPSESIAANYGFTSICEIGEERIRRAGAKIATEIEKTNRQLKLGEELKKVPDIGFRVMRIDSSNFEDVNATPEETSQQSLLALVDNVKEGRTDLDLLFEVLPKFRIPYSSPIEERNLAGKKCFIVDDNQLIACFDTEVGTDTIEEIAKMRPIYAVLRDASMADDATAANFEELFKTYSPDTVRKVI